MPRRRDVIGPVFWYIVLVVFTIATPTHAVTPEDQLGPFRAAMPYHQDWQLAERLGLFDYHYATASNEKYTFEVYAVLSDSIGTEVLYSIRGLTESSYRKVLEVSFLGNKFHYSAGSVHFNGTPGPYVLDSLDLPALPQPSGEMKISLAINSTDPLVVTIPASRERLDKLSRALPIRYTVGAQPRLTIEKLLLTPLRSALVVRQDQDVMTEGPFFTSVKLLTSAGEARFSRTSRSEALGTSILFPIAPLEKESYFLFTLNDPAVIVRSLDISLIAKDTITIPLTANAEVFTPDGRRVQFSSHTENGSGTATLELNEEPYAICAKCKTMPEVVDDAGVVYPAQVNSLLIDVGEDGLADWSCDFSWNLPPGRRAKFIKWQGYWNYLLHFDLEHPLPSKTP